MQIILKVKSLLFLIRNWFEKEKRTKYFKLYKNETLTLFNHDMVTLL